MSLYGRIFAAGYEHFTRSAERGGLRDERKRLLRGLSGHVLEIGPGPGLNFPYYPDAVTELTLAEPEPPMADKLEKRFAATGQSGRVVRAPAEDLPLGDSSVDHVVATFVLCTADPHAALAEIRRVLKPGGTFVFMEHVRSEEEPRLAAWQDRMAPAWRRFGHGCHCNRRTAQTIDAFDGLDLTDVRPSSQPYAVPLVKPLAIGTATAT